MYQGGQRHVSGNDPTRPYQTMPPPPPMSPPMSGAQAQMGNMINVPPPPPRYLATPGTPSAVNIPPPPGPFPGPNMAQQHNMQHGNTYGRLYENRGAFNNIQPPPASNNPHYHYNPKAHAQMAATQTFNQIPPPPRPGVESMGASMGATYIPTGETWGVGIPGFDIQEHGMTNFSAHPA